MRIIDTKWQEYWHQESIYKWDSNEIRENNYVIDTPPPTVSGTLHMGHIFSYTQADFLARFNRMKGKNVFYPIGFDDNGLPTERLVEKISGVKSHSMERAEFIKLCKEVVSSAEEEFRKLFKSIALSVDWSEEYQTISKRSIALSQMSFIDLYNKGHIYRKMQPCLWDPADQTALAQAEIEDKEFKSHMNYMRFRLADNDRYVVIATTRPELLPACVAVFCNPSDTRYNSLIGSSLIVPIFHQSVKIIADEKVDIEKGSGLVMCCTFGDVTDIEWWRKYDLHTINIIDKQGRLNLENIDVAADIKSLLSGLSTKQARAAVIKVLQEKEHLEKQEDITHAVKCAERSGCPIEIIITPQWFVKVLDIKDQLIERANQCNWHPPYMKERMISWINGLGWDWCISRQRYFGVPFPVWYSKRRGEEGKIIVADQQSLPIDPLVDLPDSYTEDEVVPDSDVMDTWATSSVSVQLCTHAINDDLAIDLERHKKLFPADLRPQAHEIIRTWAFYSLVKAHYHANNTPWHNLAISGWCLAADKTKMSKSKGNIITPVDLIESKGADVVRYWAANAKLGADIVYSEEYFSIAKKLINKLENASKFVSQHFVYLKNDPNVLEEDIAAGIINEKIDLWFLYKVVEVAKKSTELWSNNDYYSAKTLLENLFWNDFCDNYLEIVKVRVYNNNNLYDTGQQSSILTLYHGFFIMLKLFAPFIPHITEEIFCNIYNQNRRYGASIHQRNSWPDVSKVEDLSGYARYGELMLDIIEQVRKLKSEMNVSIKTVIERSELFLNQDQMEIFTAIKSDLQNVANILEINTVLHPKSTPELVMQKDGANNT